jgi:peptide/nickel transport system permease protein
MGRFILRRAIQGLIVILGVTVVVFVVTRLVGDPVKFILPLEATQEQRDARAAELGFDRPIITQFVDYVGDLARLDFGDSLWQRGRSTIDIVGQVLPKTFQLVAAGMLLAILIALPLGVLAATRPGTILDRLLVTTSLLGLSIPQFWLGLMLIIVFGVQLGWLPTAGTGSLNHLVLPAITIALPTAGRLAMMVRSSMIDELNRQYVKTARAKGMPSRRVIGLHALRNGSIPFITLTGWELIRALSGYTVVVEVVFNWPGLGQTVIQAIERQDLFLLQTIVLIVAVMVVVINILVDIVYKAVDPRIEVAG